VSSAFAAVKFGLALAAATLPVSDSSSNPGSAPPSREPGDTLAAAARSMPAPAADSNPAHASFKVRFKEETSPYSVIGMFVMPGEEVAIEVPGPPARPFAARAAAGSLERLGQARWSWTAPRSSGAYPIAVADSVTGETITLNAFVMVPAPAGPRLGDFRVGRYRSEPLRGDSAYLKPPGFVAVTEANRGTLVSPHFTVGQFISKQAGGYPKYLVLRERLLLKLELLLEEARRRGIPVTTFRVMSGYRTPYYNSSIGNETSYSRHLYGDAADIYVDEDGNGRMDDLDGNGRVNLDDARALAVVIDSVSDKWWYQPFVGGLGLYRGNAAHGPFIHVDVRGWRATWGP
jgi:hypothetical protein